MQSVVRTIGIVRARAKIGLQNLVYNVCSLVTLERMVTDESEIACAGRTGSPDGYKPHRCHISCLAAQMLFFEVP